MKNETESVSAGNRGRFAATVNGKEITLTDPVPTARQILDAAGFIPADDCILIQVLPQGTRAIGLDETIDLRPTGKETFWGFKSDRIFRFTVEEHGFDWGTAKIKESLLREVAHVKEDEILVLERKEEPDRELSPGDEVDFSNPGTEHLRIEKRFVEVFFKDIPYKIPRGIYTTEELKAKFPMEPGYYLNLLKPDGELVTLKPDEKIPIKCGMKFYSQVPGGGSS